MKESSNRKSPLFGVFLKVLGVPYLEFPMCTGISKWPTRITLGTLNKIGKIVTSSPLLLVDKENLMLKVLNLTFDRMESFEGDLDPVSLKIMNVYKPKDDLPKLRQENQMLRNKLRQFRDSDNKKTQDLKVGTQSKPF